MDARLTDVCPICKLPWDAHMGLEFVAHLIRAINQVIDARLPRES